MPVPLLRCPVGFVVVKDDADADADEEEEWVEAATVDIVVVEVDDVWV